MCPRGTGRATRCTHQARLSAGVCSRSTRAIQRPRSRPSSAANLRLSSSPLGCPCLNDPLTRPTDCKVDASLGLLLCCFRVHLIDPAELKDNGNITFVVLGNKARYLEVKAFFDERGMPSQVLLVENLLKGARKTPDDPIQMSYAYNVAIKVNSKLHGVNVQLLPRVASAALLAPPSKPPAMVRARVRVCLCVDR